MWVRKARFILSSNESIRGSLLELRARQKRVWQVF
jgi:hypothetical protein